MRILVPEVLMRMAISRRDVSEPTGYRTTLVDGLPPPKWKDLWRLQSPRSDAEKGSYYVLVTGSGADRISIALGWVSVADAELYCRGINALCRERAMFDWVCQQAVGRSMLPADPPVDAAFELPQSVEVGGRTIPTVSDRWLYKVSQSAGGPAEKLVAQEKIRGFLRRMAEANDHGPLDASPTSIVDAVRKARQGVDPGSLTVREYVEKYWAPHRSSDPESWRREESLIRLHMLPRLGHVPMRELDARDVHAAASQAKLATQRGGDASYRTKALARQAMATMFTWAWGAKKHLDRDLDFGKLELTGSTVRPMAQTALTGPQLKALLDAAGTERDAALLHFAFGTGARPSELARLDWAKVMWPPFNERHPHGTVHLAGTKNILANREIPMSRTVHDALHAYWVEAGKPGSGTVFTQRGAPYATGDGASYWRKMLVNTARRAKLVGLRLTPYTSRHTCATLLMKSMPPDQIRAFLGHSRVSRTLENRYDHRSVLKQISGRDIPDLRLARDAADEDAHAEQRELLAELLREEGGGG